MAGGGKPPLLGKRAVPLFIRRDDVAMLPGVAQAGIEGTYMTPAELKASLAPYVAGDATLASMGCAVTACHQFIVAFATGEQPAAFYLAFSRTEDAGYVLTGLGVSGDNAETILHGGTTFTLVGETRFAPW